jgi:hypothetical protein
MVSIQRKKKSYSANQNHSKLNQQQVKMIAQPGSVLLQTLP